MTAKKFQDTTRSVPLTNPTQQGDFANPNPEKAFHRLSYSINTPT
jgi:hypothetical protein